MSGNDMVQDDAAAVTLFLCGDVMTGRGIDQILPHPGDPRLCEPYVTSALGYVALAERAHGPIPRGVDFAYIWGAALDVLERVGPDVRIANLETSVTTHDECAPKGINYRMHPANVPCLTAAGLDCCVLANNHMLDWQREGLTETLEALEAAGIATAGAGRDRAQAAAPAAFDLGDKGRVVVFAYATPGSGVPAHWAAGARSSGVNFLAELSARSAGRVAEATAAVRRPGDIVVVSIHWGGNWGYDVPAEQRRFAHALIDRAGADVIHGHSSHHAKAIEVYRDRLILYGCGDFLNDYEGIEGYEEFRDDLAVMYLPRIAAGSGRLLGLSLTPLRIRRFALERPAGADVDWLEATLDREGRRFGTRVARAGDDTLTLAWGER